VDLVGLAVALDQLAAEVQADRAQDFLQPRQVGG
jgi:hypothetical protein